MKRFAGFNEKLWRKGRKGNAAPVSTDCKIIRKEDGRIFVDGLPSDIDAMERLLKRVGWSG